MHETVAERIRNDIAEHGPITFAAFMEHALYGPGGFYERPPVGREGHFVTSPHVHPVFSRSVGIALEELWAALGRPSPLRLVEVGAGDGTMAAELLAGFGRGGVELGYEAVEASPGARVALGEIGVRTSERLSELAPLDPGLVLANELLDNLPFRRARMQGRALVEIRVGLDGDRLVEITAPCEPELEALTPGLGPGEEAVIPTGALAFVEELARTLRRGYALLIDYGTEDGSAGEVHGYRDHRVLEDVLEDPGSADITAGVNLGLVVQIATEHGLEHFPPVTQRAALTALGFEGWERDERKHQGELLETGRGSDAVRVWGDRSRASLLVDPAALGRLRWLVLATPGLPSPEWLRRALEDRPSSD